MRVALDICAPFAYAGSMTGKALRSWMTEHRHSVRTLAAALEMHPSTVQRYRDGTLPVPRAVELALETLGGR